MEVRVVDPSKVLVNDEAIDRDGQLALQLNQRNVFDVDATAAGPGQSTLQSDKEEPRSLL